MFASLVLQLPILFAMTTYAEPTITGRVLDEAGKPVEGAEVELLSDTVLVVGEAGGAFLTISDATGAFSLPFFFPGESRIRARHADLVAYARVAVLEEEETIDAGDLVLKAGATIEGRVTDTRGLPVEGAEIRALLDQEGMESRMAFPEMGPPPDARSGSDGRFRIADLERSQYILIVLHPAYPKALVRGIAAPATNPIHIELQPSRRLSGRVVGPEGEPVLEARIETVEKTLGSTSFAELGQTNSKGEFQGSGLKPGLLDLQVTAPGYRQTQWRGIRVPQDRDPEPVTIVMERGRPIGHSLTDERGSDVAGQVERLEVLLSREAPGAITGRVLGLPPEALSRVRIQADNDNELDWPETRVDKEGRYRLSGLRSGLWYVMAIHPDGPRVWAEVQFEPGAEAVLDLQFEGLPFSGSVSLDGRPWQGAQISATSLQTRGSNARAHADSEGRFSLGPLKPGPHTVLIHSSSLGIYRTVLLQEGQELRLEIETGGLQGHILSKDGEPVPDATIQLRITEPATGRSIPDWGPSVRSDAQGAFEMLSIPAGSYTVVVQKPGYQEFQERVEVGPGGPMVQDFVLVTGE